MDNEDRVVERRFKVTVQEVGVKRTMTQSWADCGGGKMDWTPPRESESDYSITRYEQTVDSLDVQAVVQAVNGGAR